MSIVTLSAMSTPSHIPHYRRSRMAAPGKRRVRRYLNDLVSESESEYYYSISEGDEIDDDLWEDRDMMMIRPEEMEEEIIRFEWEGQFIKAGPEFFDHQQLTNHKRLDKRDKRDRRDGGSRIQRRLEKLERERKQMREKRKQRRQQALIQKEQQQQQQQQQQQPEIRQPNDGDIISTPPSTTSVDTDTSQPMSRLSLHASDDTIMRDDVDNDINHLDDRLDDLDLSVSSRLPGQSVSWDLWLMIERRTRTLLKHMHDFTFLQQMEQLINIYKQQQLLQQMDHRSMMMMSNNIISEYFTILPHHNSNMMDDDKDKDAILLSIPDPFIRSLTRGILSFHCLYANTIILADGRHILRIRKQKGNAYVPHTASLEKHIKQHFAVQ